MRSPVEPRTTDHLALHPLDRADVRITEGFWARWRADNRAVTIPHALAWLEREGVVDNFRRLAPGASGDLERRAVWFSDSDLYKTLEGMSWAAAADDDGLAERVTALARTVAAAQEGDGYVNTWVQAGKAERWADLPGGHEMYCIGHLVQAGIAHRRTTGDDSLFDVAVAAADAVVHDFGDHRQGGVDGHQEIESALVELYRETGEDSYLQLARQLVDARGHGILGDWLFGSAYFQDDVPVREQRVVAGHCVRAVYGLAGVVDLYLETGDRALLDAALAQWADMTATKTYLTGALGSRFEGEAFGEPWELPPDLAYGETCATIGNVMLSWRLLLATGDGRFADAIERALHNLLAASTSTGRDAFFYSNPAQRRAARPAADPDHAFARTEAPGSRAPWFEVACCPPNVIRTIAALDAYLATSDAEGVQVHQYLPAEIGRDGIRLAVQTRYPLDGHVRVVVGETPHEEWTLSLRIPAWASGFGLAVAGETVDVPVTQGYARIARRWHAGDVVELDLPMTPRITVPHPAVDALRGTAAIERGPVVYCLEGLDQPAGVSLDQVEIVAGGAIRELPVDGDTVTLRVPGRVRDDDGWQDTGWSTLGSTPPESTRSVDLVAIPYRLWANRGPSTMRVFVPIVGGP